MSVQKYEIGLCYYVRHSDHVAEVERLQALVPDDEENAQIVRLKAEHLRLRQEAERLRADLAVAKARVLEEAKVREELKWRVLDLDVRLNAAIARVRTLEAHIPAPAALQLVLALAEGLGAHGLPTPEEAKAFERLRATLKEATP